MSNSDRPTPAEASARAALTRRDFTALSLAAGVGAVSGAARATPGAGTTAADVEVPTPAGRCDASLARPAGAGKHPAAILFVDVFGLRPTMIDMAKRLAAEGYAVLVPNPYYRSTKAPGIAPGFDFGSTTDRAKLATLRAPLTNEGVMQDAAAYVAFLDSQPFVDRHAPVGVFGYCMGGPMTMQAAAGVPERIRAGASFHGGGLVTNGSDSPHLLVPRIKAQFYFAVAASDDDRQPDAKTQLEAAFKAVNRPAKIEVYAGTIHGWCVKDMPLQDGKPIYNEPQAERAWGDLVGLFHSKLATA